MMKLSIINTQVKVSQNKLEATQKVASEAWQLWPGLDTWD